MQRIYKYPLTVTDKQTVYMPQGASVLSLDTQNRTPTIWAAVDPDQDNVAVNIVMAGTGHTLPDIPLKHIGTAQIDGFVWHYFIEA